MLFYYILFLSLINFSKASNGDDVRGIPWPLPQLLNQEDAYFSVNVNQFDFILKDIKLNDCDILKDALNRYRNIIKSLPKCNGELLSTNRDNYLLINDYKYKGALTSLTIELKENKNCTNLYPHLYMDEMYKINIDTDDFPKSAFLFANHIWGLLRGLETFVQLLYQISSNVNENENENELFINRTSIIDYPRFTHRGLLLDTSRHYLTISKLKANLDLMAINKFNVFHWHIVDDQSFPYESIKYPEMSGKGAFSCEHIYTQDNIKDIIEYARVRGIRVMVEFDTPGHTQSWGKSIDNLLTKCFYLFQSTYGPIDPTNDNNYIFLNNFFGEIVQKFPDKYLHIGGDEVEFNCWRSNPKINEFMRKMNFSDNYKLLENYYINNLLNIIDNYKRDYVVWQEVFDNNVTLNNRSIVQVWLGNDQFSYHNEMKKIINKGYKVLLSSPWYLNIISYGVDWHKYYQVEPVDPTWTENQKKYVLGGEACMWGEMVDGTNVISRIWPRASAVGERLWSSEYVDDVNAATSRLHYFRCNLLRRGFMVEPIIESSYCDCDLYVN